MCSSLPCVAPAAYSPQALSFFDSQGPPTMRPSITITYTATTGAVGAGTVVKGAEAGAEHLQQPGDSRPFGDDVYGASSRHGEDSSAEVAGDTAPSSSHSVAFVACMGAAGGFAACAALLAVAAAVRRRREPLTGGVCKDPAVPLV